MIDVLSAVSNWIKTQLLVVSLSLVATIILLLIANFVAKLYDENQYGASE